MFSISIFISYFLLLFFFDLFLLFYLKVSLMLLVNYTILYCIKNIYWVNLGNSLDPLVI